MEAASATDLRVDTHLAKFSQGSVVVLTALAFLLSWPPLVLITGLLLAWSALWPTVGPFTLLYRHVLVPSGLLKPRLVEDDPAPHRFAQGVGATLLLVAGLVLLLTAATMVGWVLDLLVFVLSFVNLTVGFCAGCLVYYYLGKLGLVPRVRYEGGFHWRGVR
ncbi:MAG: DUF4395 domain-containing protein [Thermogemmatispora sp.]|uniref:DUF4395 domain-containing protein n=1 Tax=Thermogemmatispora aurantia TaxID=2045279 RepID=A0A5J4K8K0_9CHLR|nr:MULTISPECIES: DUF4395 domain-containing protein [Thermogemmatispora]MBE3566405.1 DUF4395 domain-containing protein [Thermogemmatispora sp.]GER83039.1 hypothetical protein KTAU_16760 [Thermogemmatispora aurantia]